MIVVTRFRVPSEGVQQFRDDLVTAHEALAACRGYLDGPDLWVLTTRWENVGAYRRALSSYDVKMRAVPVLYRAVDEPSAYEVVDPGADLNVASARSLG